MKRMMFFSLFLVVSMNTSLFASRDHRYLTPSQELAIFSLANRYLEAFCNNPRDLSRLLEGSVIPRGVIHQTVDIFDDLLRVEGECFGQPKDLLQESMLYGIEDIAGEILEAGIATESSLKDFADCLVNIENYYYNLAESTTRIFECVYSHLDVRSVLYSIFINEPYIVDEDPIIPVIEPVLPFPPVENTCFDLCMADCNNFIVSPEPVMPL